MKLKEIGEIITGNTPKTSNKENYDSNDVCFAKPSDFFSDVTLLNNTEFYISENARDISRIAPKGSILVTCIGIIGKIAILEKECAFNQQINAIKVDDKIANNIYVAYAILFQKNFLQKISNSAVVPIINKTIFSNIEIPLPSIEKQNNIATILCKIDEIIFNRKQQLLKLDELVKSRFIEMFGDPITNEMGWKASLWSKVLNIKNGRNQKEVENSYGKYPICGSGGVMGFADDYITESHSVIIGRKGNINKPILMRERFWNVDTAFGLEPHCEILTVDYLFIYCLFFDFKRLNRAVTIPSLTKADLQDILMPIPPIELQKRFSAFVEQVDKLKLAIEKSIEKLEILKKSLMQEYFG